MSRLVLDTAALGSLKGKVVVLTGGSQGIGKAAVSTFHGTRRVRMYHEG